MYHVRVDAMHAWLGSEKKLLLVGLRLTRMLAMLVNLF